MAMEGKKAFLKIHATVNATPGLPLQQLQNALGALIGLRQNRRGSLLDNLRASKIGRCGRVIRILNLTAGLLGIRHNVGQIVDDMGQPVHHRTHARTRRVDLIHGGIKTCQNRRG